MAKNKKEPEGEELWNLDVIDLLRPEIESYVVAKHKVAKALAVKKKNNDFCFYSVFSEQDVVIYRGEDSFCRESTGRDKDKCVIPRIICELKYEGVNTTALIAVSDTASKIKSIFPECKMILLVRYSGNKEENNEKLLRWGQGFDRIMCLETGKKKRKYVRGAFAMELQNSAKLKDKWKKLVKYIQEALSGPGEGFVK